MNQPLLEEGGGSDRPGNGLWEGNETGSLFS